MYTKSLIWQLTFMSLQTTTSHDGVSFAGSFGVDEQLKLEINGKPVVYEDSVFKLCGRPECEAVDLQLKSSGTRTFVGGNMTVVLSSDESKH